METSIEVRDILSIEVKLLKIEIFAYSDSGFFNEGGVDAISFHCQLVNQTFFVDKTSHTNYFKRSILYVLKDVWTGSLNKDITCFDFVGQCQTSSLSPASRLNAKLTDSWLYLHV